MRRITGESGIRSETAYATVAVTSTATLTPSLITDRFVALGFAITEDDHSSNTRRDRAVVLTAVRVGEGASVTTIMRLIEPGLAIGAFQPVWNASRWCRTGLELLVADDNDACSQLDALSEVLDTERELITIKPCAGWQGYGHPAVVDLG